ncbi:ankyrin repeat-containing protein [Tanacetum coccineum]
MQARHLSMRLRNIYGYVDLIRILIDWCDIATASIKANNGFDALIFSYYHNIFKLLPVFFWDYRDIKSADGSTSGVINDGTYIKHHLFAHRCIARQISMSSPASIARSYGKTALHPPSRNGHLRVVKAVLEQAPGISPRNDKKGGCESPES